MVMDISFLLDLPVHLRVVFTVRSYTVRGRYFGYSDDLESKSKATSEFNSYAFDNKFKA